MIYKVRHTSTRRYLGIDRTYLEDPSLSWGARALACYIETHSDVDFDHLTAVSPDDQGTIQAFLLELKRRNYLANGTITESLLVDL